MNSRDLLYEKEVIKLHAEKMRNLIRVHSDLIFKNKKGVKFKEDLLYSLMLITDMLDRSPTDFYKIDKTYRAVENLVNCEIENQIKKDEQKIQKPSEPEYKELRIDGRLFHYKTDSSKTLCPHCHTFVDKVSSSCWSCGKSLMDPSNSSSIQSNEEEKLKAFEDWRKRQSNSSASYNSSKERENDGRAIGAFVMGICGLVLPYLGLICAIIGACLGSPYTKGLGYAGKVMSWISIIVSIVVLIVFCSAAMASVGQSNGLL